MRPRVQRLALAGDDGARGELLATTSPVPRPVRVGMAGTVSTVTVHDAAGTLVRTRTVSGPTTVVLPAGGFAVVLAG